MNIHFKEHILWLKDNFTPFKQAEWNHARRSSGTQESFHLLLQLCFHHYETMECTQWGRAHPNQKHVRASHAGVVTGGGGGGELPQALLNVTCNQSQLKQNRAAGQWRVGGQLGPPHIPAFNLTPDATRSVMCTRQWRRMFCQSARASDIIEL